MTILFVLIGRAENGIRTRDPQLGKLMLYQLSYFRNSSANIDFFIFINKSDAFYFVIGVCCKS